ncbi:hypothetical protein [Sorangium sp. So ce426]|uniref:hypothetical protein n=1 Tax=Sorangium sp. So ce426 TaxID=3133312 RepID=UPI003F5AF013
MNDDAGVPFDEGTNPCSSQDNPAGEVKELAWPAASNTGHTIEPGQTLRFKWSGTHSVVQVADWDGTPIDASLGRRIDSGAPTNDGTFDWNVGGFACGYRPGLYYFKDGAGGGGVTAVSLTEPEFGQNHFDPKPCSTLSDVAAYGGRYASYAGREDCTIHEVNNFQTEPHHDWVDPTFAAQQGDLVLFRWTGYHSVVQVHDVTQDTLFGPGGVTSGAKRNCTGGPNYLCSNGSSSLGEHMIDTTDWRPGMIHISDECAYNHADCPSKTGNPSPTGVNMQYLLRARSSPIVGAKGSCCAIDKSKGQACRVVDFYNDRDGFQYEYNVGVNRGDIVRLRWSGKVRMVQVQAAPGSDDPSTTPLAGGLSAPEYDCVPGPKGSCIGGDASRAELILDVDAAIESGKVHSGGGETFFLFHAFGENMDGYSSADADVSLYLAQETPYSDNDACP